MPLVHKPSTDKLPSTGWTCAKRWWMVCVCALTSTLRHCCCTPLSVGRLSAYALHSLSTLSSECYTDCMHLCHLYYCIQLTVLVAYLYFSTLHSWQGAVQSWQSFIISKHPFLIFLVLSLIYSNIKNFWDEFIYVLFYSDTTESFFFILIL